MGRGEEFLDLYRNLEAHIQAEYELDSSESALFWLGRNRPEFQSYRVELDYCRDVRNLLSHNPKLDGDFPVEPTEKMMDLLNRVYRAVVHPLTARDVAVERKNVVGCTSDDLVADVMKQMVEHKFSHIPILDDSRVQGVFSESALLAMLVEAPELFQGDATIGMLSRFTALDSPIGETYRFVRPDTSVTTLGDIFEDSLGKGEKVGMVFLTQDGKATQRIMGIVTAWDIAGCV